MFLSAWDRTAQRSVAWGLRSAPVIRDASICRVRFKATAHMGSFMRIFISASSRILVMADPVVYVHFDPKRSISAL